MQVDQLLKPFPIKEFHPFPRALMGPGSVEIVGPEALKLGFKKVLLMTSGLRGTEIVSNLKASLEYHGLDVVLYDKVESNPKDYNAMDGAKLFMENDCDSFISVGGGSSHDACKGARIAVAHDGRNINEFEGFNKSENQKNPPHIAISTTAGTGSETSWAYVITDTTTDPSKPHKYVAFDDAAVATLAIDDPTLYFDCPTRFTAQCGFDVLAHGSEPYVSRLNFEPSLGNALRSIELVGQNLRKATWNGEDLASREGMMYAQYIAAQAFNSGGLGIIHSISHATCPRRSGANWSDCSATRARTNPRPFTSGTTESSCSIPRSCARRSPRSSPMPKTWPRLSTSSPPATRCSSPIGSCPNAPC